MGILEKATEGIDIGAQIHAVIGDNGVGKTTWGVSFPNTICFDLENGSRHLKGFKRIKASEVPDLETLRAALKELKDDVHPYKNVVIDSVESLEGMISDFVCKEGGVKSIELYAGGFGNGFTRTREVMREIIEQDLRALQAIDISTVLVGHTQTKNKADPISNTSYDRVIMRCNDKMGAVVRDLADNVLYVTHKVLTVTEKNKTKAYGDGQRVMYTQWRPGFDAKNRLNLPYEIPLSYEAFIDACNAAATTDVSEILKDITEMSAGLSEDLKKSVNEQVEKYKTNAAKLHEVKNRLMKYVAA